MSWLGRTANALPHAATGKVPHDEMIIEEPLLKPYQACTAKVIPITAYAVRKDNSVSYKGNFYSLPLGTYQGKGTLVALRIEQGYLIISDPQDQQEICRHKVAVGKGGKISNTDHKRDKSAAINEMIEQVSRLFKDEERGKKWLNMIRSDKPRYIRDQLIMIKETLTSTDPDRIDKTLDYCLSNQIYSAADFKSILASLEPRKTEAKIILLNPLSESIPEGANLQPDTNSINDYESLF